MSTDAIRTACAEAKRRDSGSTACRPWMQSARRVLRQSVATLANCDTAFDAIRTACAEAKHSMIRMDGIPEAMQSARRVLRQRQR